MYPENPRAIKIFFSYAHEDEELRAQLVDHLGLMKQSGLIDAWHDRLIEGGEKWETKIDEQLNEAQIILLLVSEHFIGSAYCTGIELKRAMERHEAGECVVIPVILGECDWAWSGAPFSKLQALPTGGKAVTSWPNQAGAFTNVTKGIRAVVEKLRAASPASVGVKGKVPSLLPYLCDRSDQEIALGGALSKHQAHAPRRPFVCIVHGDEYESHSDFLDRLQQVSMPHILSLLKRGLSIADFPLEWPSSIRAEQASEIFQGALGLSLTGSSATPAERLFDDVPLERPVMLTLRLKTEDFATGGTSSLAAFFKFWNEWDDLPPGRTLLNVISIRHQRIDELGFFRRWKLKKVDEELRAYLDKLSFSVYEKLPGLVLPELQAISHHHVVTWSNSKEVRAICRIREEEIDRLFARRPGHTIPMQLLAEELERLVIKYRH